MGTKNAKDKIKKVKAILKVPITLFHIHMLIRIP